MTAPYGSIPLSRDAQVFVVRPLRGRGSIVCCVVQTRRGRSAAPQLLVSTTRNAQRTGHNPRGTISPFLSDVPSFQFVNKRGKGSVASSSAIQRSMVHLRGGDGIRIIRQCVQTD